jgi:hypothetical protein
LHAYDFLQSYPGFKYIRLQKFTSVGNKLIAFREKTISTIQFFILWYDRHLRRVLNLKYCILYAVSYITIGIGKFKIYSNIR